jgi:outer membrane protein assembly factor BamA
MTAALLALLLAAAQATPAAGAPEDPAAEGPAPGPESSPSTPPGESASASAPGSEPAPSLAERSRRYQVERLELRGFVRTRASEARRHVLVSEGDPFDPDRVLLSRLRLLQLGWYSRVETRVERGSARGLVVVVFQVVERNTVVITDLVLGSTPAQPFYGGLGLSQLDLLRRGLALSGAFVYGGSAEGRPQEPDRLAVRTSLFAPDLRLLGLRTVLGASAWLLRGEEYTCGEPACDAYARDLGDAPRLLYQRVGGELSAGFRSSAFERLIGSYRYERVLGRVRAGEGTDSGPAPPLLPGWSDVSALSVTYEKDTRDDFFFPTEGLRTLAQLTFGSRLLGADYEYSRYLLELESAFALLRRPLRFQAGLGVVQGGAPFFDRFYAADVQYFSVGPALGRALELNFSTDSRYDAFLAHAGLEYAVPLFAGDGFFRRGYLALGLRGVWSTATLGGGRSRVSRMPASADIALRLDTPVGDFNVSLGYALDIVL